MTTPIAVLGAGSWGTALAILFARNGHPCTLWGHHPEHVAALAANRSNSRYLPDIPFPAPLQVSDDVSAITRRAAIIVLAVPSHAFRDTLKAVATHLPKDARIAWATKGLEPESGRLLHEVVAEILGAATPAAVLSGPTFAGEVAAGLPSAITVASRDSAFARQLAMVLHNEHFRAYTSDDLIGVQLGGATKNVLAIAVGVADGLALGANARAALITRGLAELMRLGLAMGGRSETLMGLSGVGDLILTCTDNQSRNRRFGLGLGQGLDRSQIAASIGQEIEGIGTARLVYRLSQDHGIDMPITEQVYRILYEGLSPPDAVRNLLLRRQKAESLC